MAITPEGKVKQWLREAMKNKYPKSWHYAPPAGPYGQIGVSDDFWIIPTNLYNVFVVIESKADHTRKPTQPQLDFLIKLKGLNCICAIMYGKDKNKLDDIFNKIDNKINELNNLSVK